MALERPLRERVQPESAQVLALQAWFRLEPPCLLQSRLLVVFPYFYFVATAFGMSNRRNLGGPKWTARILPKSSKSSNTSLVRCTGPSRQARSKPWTVRSEEHT